MSKKGFRVLKDNILVREVKKRKESAIIMVGGNDDDNWEVTFEIRAFGHEAKERAALDGVKIGDFPVFAQYFQARAYKNIVEKPKQLIVSEFICSYDDLIAVDDSTEPFKYEEE